MNKKYAAPAPGAHLQLGLERLLKLTQHLEGESLGVDEFDLGLFYHQNECGTAGCALGCCPTVFPEDWIIQNDLPIVNNPELFCDFDYDSVISAWVYFRLTSVETKALFLPYMQHYLPEPILPELTGDATPKQVAANIRTFVAWKQKQLNLN